MTPQEHADNFLNRLVKAVPTKLHTGTRGGYRSNTSFRGKLRHMMPKKEKVGHYEVPKPKPVINHGEEAIPERDIHHGLSEGTIDYDNPSKHSVSMNSPTRNAKTRVG